MVFVISNEPTVDADVYQQKSRKCKLPAFCLIILKFILNFSLRNFLPAFQCQVQCKYRKNQTEEVDNRNYAKDCSNETEK